MLSASPEATPALLTLLFAGSLMAGAQNALAGGGTFITLPIMLLTGLDAKAANIGSAVALFPTQMVLGWRSLPMAGGTSRLSLKVLVLISLVGGLAGAGVLLLTPSRFFEGLIPYLVLFATCAFAWGSFGPKPHQARRENAAITAVLQFATGVYGGYFGGGNGFLLLAALTFAGQGVRTAGATKNVVSAAMNLTAVGAFLVMAHVAWLQVAITATGAMIGGNIGVWLLGRLNEKVLRVVIVGIGLALSIGLFVRAYF
jgi:uncharacterized membrane protein YfcA